MSLIHSFSKNKLGRDFVVGDIHGCFDQLDIALKATNFDTGRDRLFSVGDLIDRGPYSERCLEFMSKPWFHTVLGNHEQMAMEYLLHGIDEDSYRINGGQWLIDISDPQKRQQFINAFAALPILIEVETDNGLVGVVHAECPTHSWNALKSALQNPDVSHHFIQRCLWSRKVVNDLTANPVHGVLAINCGHTIVKEPTKRGNHLFIDLGAFKSGRLCLGQIQGKGCLYV